MGELSVRLKLVYALGVITRHEYEDAELLMALREELNHDGTEYRFTDDEILGPFGELHCVAELPPVPTFLRPDEADASLIAMQRQRYQANGALSLWCCRLLNYSPVSVKNKFLNSRHSAMFNY